VGENQTPQKILFIIPNLEKNERDFKKGKRLSLYLLVSIIYLIKNHIFCFTINFELKIKYWQ
jgi:hypothetical protein